MNFQETLEKRRSVRNYIADKEIDKDTINKLIQAASLAPSWKNSQTGRYYCVMSKDMLIKFRETCLPEFNTNNTINASAYIVTTFVKDRAGFDRTSGMPVNKAGNGWGFYDLGLQNENLVLKAKDMGLDTLIMGIRDEEKIREMLSIPEEQIIVSVIAVGYSDAKPDMPKRKDTEEIVSFF